MRPEPHGVDSRIMNQKGHAMNIKEKYKWNALFPNSLVCFFVGFTD